MLFNSYEFIFAFLPISFFLFWFLSRFGVNHIAIFWLIVCSFFFYGWWNPSYIFLLFLSIVLNYKIGTFLSNLKEEKSKNIILFIGVFFNLSMIGYYKYYNFFISVTNGLFKSHFQDINVILPLAISFFTFQQIAFLIDARNDINTKYSFMDYLFFVSFFPQLIAGPIVHHKEIIPQIKNELSTRVSLSHFNIGLTIFFFGLFKKVVIADRIASYSTPIFLASDQGILLNFFEAWIGALAYTFQLYFDFSGYSDMAIGIARMFTIRLPLNFNSPYKAQSIIDFWRRWHITLSRFLRDYLYISLGGNRKGLLRRYLNLMITMVLGGLWHGAGWTFILWGALHGAYLVVNHLFIKTKKYFNPFFYSCLIFRSLSVIVTFLCVVVAWVFFRSNSIAGALNIIKSMTGLNGISFPSVLSGRLGELEFWLMKYGVNFDGFSKNKLISFDGIIWIFILLFFVWGLPNTQEIMAKFKPVLTTYMNVKEHRLIFWYPKKIWAIGIGLIATLSILSLNRISEFLYFQF